ncbi:hypothetical protein AAC387_Pa08g0684 [Persea americana]
MSFDGSFTSKSALERFLARCPKLQSNLRFLKIVQKGDAMTDDEVVNLLAEPLLHPNYTIPLFGCFRPLGSKIVERAVSLLWLVPEIKMDSGWDDKEEISEDDINVIEFYAKSGRGLRLHELTSLALCRVLDLAPSLLGSVISYFRFAPPPFKCLSMIHSALNLSEQDQAHLVDVIRVSYRFLLMEPKVFSELWNWSFFLDLVQQCSADVGLVNGSEVIKNIHDLRWCGIQILSVILRISDRATENFGLIGDTSYSCFLRWEEFCQDVSLEKAGYYLEANEVETGEFLEGKIDFSPGYFLQSFNDGCPVISSSRFYEIKSIKRNRRKAACITRSVETPFVLTSAVKKSFEMVLLALNQRWPVLLHGPTGSGKTALISKLAQVSGNQVLFLHMDEQLDSKSLIGSYICTERPGEFKWQPGSLTQALVTGLWVVFEDIDKAPSEVLSILLPLLEGASSFATGRGEAVNVGEGFRLFATVSSSKHDFCHTAGRISLGVLWRKVMIGNPSYEDMSDIIGTWYPSLQSLSEELIATFKRVNTFYDRLAFNRFSLRDLLKWCKRIAGSGFSFSGLALTDSICKRIYQEAVDIFAASSTSSITRLSLMKEIASIWNIPISQVDSFYPPNKPIIQSFPSELQVGRVALERTHKMACNQMRVFVDIRSSLYVLERIACSVKYNEPVLLVGETGTGKTTIVQNLAARLGQPLTVLNLSQQSDVADLLGGYKPADVRMVFIPLHEEFKDLFCKTFSVKGNDEYLRRLEVYAMKKYWKKLLHAFQKIVDLVGRQVSESGESGCGTKRKRPLTEEVIRDWESFSMRIDAARNQLGNSTHMSFCFVEGAFITSLKKGHWILLDEVNLAPPETLQRIIGVLEGENGTLCLSERGDVDYINRHPQFRIFACMNPATDAGKRDLPYSLRSRFTEYFVDDILDREELILFIGRYMNDVQCNRDIVDKVVDFYLNAKKESEDRLQDGANQKPQFSLRSLARALEYTMKAKAAFGFERALYDGFCMFFLTLLDASSAKRMNDMILKYFLGGNPPPNVSFDRYLEKKPYSRDIQTCDAFFRSYILTESVEEHLRDLARAVFIRKYPVLLQGPTSSGKTSLVQYLAVITGHEFVRINNHEHTDLQEYFGSYITDSDGKLTFQEGALVKAVRCGYWIVLDELNLAPSDVLEALNRLLDDNRELFVPELQRTLTAHPDFMLFATQNPPTFYGGRKMLSRAFRNRFLEIQVDEIPENELSRILKRRCSISKHYASKMVNVMKDLQVHRQSSNVFAGKHGFITPRDLFRWADRFRTFYNPSKDLPGKNPYEYLAKEGYFLLAERLRDDNEKNVVQEFLEKRLSVKLIKDELYKQEMEESNSDLDLSKHSIVLENLGTIIWTRSMWRLYFLVERCYKLREPVLLVGETGGGKTTVCQLLSIVMRSRLHTLNCHMYTETSDFLGGFYPVRDRSRLAMEFKHHIEKLKQSKIFLLYQKVTVISSDIEQASSTLNQLNEVLNDYRQGAISHPDVREEDLDAFEQVKLNLLQLQQSWQTLFLWQDGPLVQAMKAGDLLLVDEISLADDSVLERLNSVLESERKLSLAEKGGPELEKITAHPNFFLLATMNPGGDYGKKELSPALRNRFTEIWVPPVTDLNELRSIAAERLINSEISSLADSMIKFWEWFNQLQTGRVLTVRDLLSWVAFINATGRSLGYEHAFIHGAFLVLLDGLSLGTGISKHDSKRLRERCLSFLLEQIQEGNSNLINPHISKMENYGWGDIGRIANLCPNNGQSEHLFGVYPFYIVKGDKDCKREGFEFFAPTTRRNALRVLRALQLPKPVLVEGSPGVGKTSLVVALAEFSGHTVVRINLSEQTDIMDLLGSDLPVEGEKGMKFAWSDGILLQALKNGSWVLLDELNLAPQSVLEGLNAILDHRAEVYIPELGQSFKCPPSFRVFACQNPSCQGGGRKGLPKSFLNRFTKVYVDELVEDDYLFICSSLYPTISKELLSKLIHFNNRLYEDTMLSSRFGQDGSPWEFNLRDIIRSCQIIESAPEKSRIYSFLDIVYIQRMRTVTDRKEVLKLFEEVFGMKLYINQYPRVQVNPRYLIVGNAYVERNYFQPSKVLKSQLHILPGICYSLEAALQCVQHQWLCILVGPSSSGKTSLIRLLAQLTGNTLNELNLSSGTDISELLGCFEQYSAFRKCRSVIAEVERYINEYSSLCLESSAEAFMMENKDLVGEWLTFVSSKNRTFDSEHVEHWKGGPSNLLSELVKIIEKLKGCLERNHLPVSWSYKELNKSLKTIFELQENNRMQSFSPKFEWVSGGLVKAIEHGEWIVLENANLCNPTVLDRINSLVEPSGSITVNECGLVDGKPLVLHAHPKFRMFLTVDPRYGEISRAMRNRGVEVYMMQPYCLLDDCSSYDSTEAAERRDLKRFLVLSGIPVRKLVDAMADAHIYVRDEGLRLGIHVTLLELTRWVQLFQQLIMNGNRPTWSLQVSWEHIYLSSFGEAEGSEIIEHVKHSILLASDSSVYDPLLGCSSSLPGGWPAPLKLRNFVWHSKEACIKQNCMYLDFLGAECAKYNLTVTDNRSLSVPVPSLTSIGHTDISLLDATKRVSPSVIPIQILHHILFPNSARGRGSKSTELPKFDLARANKMMFFAANWTIEQANESDIASYLLWFRWYSSQIQPYCGFFDSFLTILEQEINHPILTFIVDCRREIISSVDLDRQPVPLFTLELAESYSSNVPLLTSRKHLSNAIYSVSLLTLSLQQWNIEDEYACGEEKQLFRMLPMLKSLRQLEKKVLNLIVESPCFDLLFQLYSDLLEHHTWFWKDITSFDLECLFISWCSLKKDAIKLHNICAEEVDSFLVESRNLDEVSSWNFHSQKSMLWVHGGHPFVPSSAGLYFKMQQLLELCDEIWPRKPKSWKQISSGDNCFMAVASATTGLRHLAMEGVCMSSYFVNKCSQHQEDADIVHQLGDIYQMLQERFEYEKQNLKRLSTGNNTQFSLEEKLASFCCAFFPEMVCSNSGFGSWLDTLPLLDRKSLLLDVELLEKLSQSILVDVKDLHAVLSSISGLLEYVLKFSMDFSSRPPTDFLPHQKILWLLDAWTLVDSVSGTVASFVIEMWFKWHSSMWTYGLKLLKNFSNVSYPGNQVPCIPFEPTKLSMLCQILQHSFPVVDFPIHCLKLRVSSSKLWRDFPLKSDLASTLFSAAHSLFQQIIFAHEKSFEVDNFGKIKSIFHSIQENSFKQEELQTLKALIQSSNQGRLTSLVDQYIVPLLRELYIECPSHDYLYNLGKAWIHIGGLRFNLLANPDYLDPAMKYEFKYLRLQEKISLLELEIKVRQECDHLAGRNSTVDDEKWRKSLLGKLQKERKRLQTKIMFRPDPAKYKKLKSVCAEFHEFVASSAELARNLDQHDVNIQLRIDEACNWQVTSASFIDQLSEEYPEYIDIIQPVQVAIYEIKLGLSVAVSSALQKAYLHEVGGNADQILETIYSLLQFPRSWPSEAISVDPDTMLPVLQSSNMDVSENALAMDVNLLKKLLSISRDTNCNKELPILQLHANIYHISIVRVARHVRSTMLMDNASFLFLNKIFDQFASLWINMKVHIKAKEDIEAQKYKFRPRSLRIEDILEVDVSSLMEFSADERLSPEWQELMKSPAKENGKFEEEWNLVQESVLKSMVHLHNQLFGSNNLIKLPGIAQVNNEDILDSFMDSYKLGIKIIKDMPPLLSFTLDMNLMPEHLLHLCVHYKQKFSPFHQLDHVYNIYKDSNAPALAKMVKPLTVLQNRAVSLIDEWPEHPGLQMILDIIKTLLALSVDTPLTKALLGLQFLLSRTQALQENASKFSFSDQLQPFFALVSSWQKLELTCWPALLDGVMEQCDANAGKLWLPLYSVLHREHFGDSDYLYTIQSLEEFIQTASVGEFRKRLELLLAFHGQFSMRMRMKADPSPHLMEILKILYNVFGYHMQFLPLISEHVEASRRNIEKELKEVATLSQWDLRQCYLSIENSRRIRHKILKLIQKFSDTLQQPVMIVLNQEEMRKRMKIATLLEENPVNDAHEMNTDTLANVLGLAQFNSADRSLHYGGWKKKFDFALEYLCSKLDLPSVPFMNFEGVADLLRQSLSSASEHQMCHDGWKEGWTSLEDVYRIATDCTFIWKHGTKNPKKRRALADLFEILERCGLSKHESIFFEEEFKSTQSIGWFLQPSYDVQHLLLPLKGSSPENVKSTSLSDHFHKPPHEVCDPNWEVASQYYFKNLAMMQQLQKIRLNFHKDLTLDQVNRSASFLNHLIKIQQDQRSVAYSFAEQMKRLRRHTSLLREFDQGTGTECYVTLYQIAVHKYMWQQKQLFDSLFAMASDASLLLKTVENTHLNTCNVIKSEVSYVSAFIDMFIPAFQKSKDALDRYLLGSNGIIVTPAACTPPFVVSKQMEQLVIENFDVINDFEECFQTIYKQAFLRRSVDEPFLNRFRDIIDRGRVIMEEFSSELENEKKFSSICEDGDSSADDLSKLYASFAEIYEGTIRQVVDAFERLSLSNKGHILPESSVHLLTGNLPSWKVSFDFCLEALQLNHIYDALGRTIIAAGKLVSTHRHSQFNLCLHIQASLKYLHALLEVLLTVGDGILSELLALHKTVGEMTYMLANMFALLYSKGFGTPKGQVDNGGNNTTQDANGTGMGEGEGVNDVSDQIDDEDQLLGTFDKQSEGPDASNDIPSKDGKGIEMEQDFAADTFSVSEDSGDDADDGCEEDDDTNLDSVMGEGADRNGEIVDEKLWDKDEDGNPHDTIEKYESGSSVRETDPSSREVRAKEDSATAMDDYRELNNDETDKLSDKDENPDVNGDDHGNTNEMKLDKETAFEDPSGIQLDDQQVFEDESMDKGAADPDAKEEGSDDPNDTANDMDTDDGETNPMDDLIDDANPSQVDANVENDEQGMEGAENGDKDMGTKDNELTAPGMDPADDSILNTDSLQPVNKAGPTADSSLAFESDSRDPRYSLAPSRNLPSDHLPEMGMTLPISRKGEKSTSDQPKAQSPQDDTSSAQRTHSNPFRSIGDALEEWKERIKICADGLQENEPEAPDVLEDKNADEYEFVSELEKGTSQALGPATSDQIDRNIKKNKSYADNSVSEQKRGEDEMRVVDEDSEIHHIGHYNASALRQKMDEQMQESGITSDVPMEEELPEVDGQPGNQSGDLIIMDNSYMNNDILKLNNLSMIDQDLGKVKNIEEVSVDTEHDNAAAIWRRYELTTTRLSQELTEQLRLVMEPTVASKLQGDYKTGKRINMKKVIPYIASHYRKDKIWLRRTRPNKRDYQVVVAIDDSRSMSESRCGEVAIEALITVCRAMSQLEVGQLAAVSFGAQGNVRLLQGFSQPFTGEAGIKMISSLTFKQDNTIADEPMVNLLKELNGMLDSAIANARLPTGQNPLQQLILIIADGRFHEKESLKRYVRDVLSRKRMIAFILLDSPQESIMDLMRVTHRGGKFSVSRYINSFPFPYYVVLKNIESLPRTMADLLRQWFELMQSSGD